MHTPQTGMRERAVAIRKHERFSRLYYRYILQKGLLAQKQESAWD